MTKALFFLPLLLITALVSAQRVTHEPTRLILEGEYSGKNLYVQNPISSAGVGFSITSVSVNGQEYKGSIISSAFEVDLSPLKADEAVTIEIFHEEGTFPKVLNAEDLGINPNDLKAEASHDEMLLPNIKLEGTFRGKNVFVSNPENDAGTGFCVAAVYVNDEMWPVDVESSAFEIDLRRLGYGTKVVIQIFHEGGCQPQVLNPTVSSHSSKLQKAK